MDLRTYLKSLADEDARESFAQRCSTSLGHMRNCLYVEGKKLAPETCVLVERATDGEVTRRDLRPDDWWLIWPELVTAQFPIPGKRSRKAAA